MILINVCDTPSERCPFPFPPPWTLQSTCVFQVNAKDLPTANSRFHELKTLMSRSWLCATRDPNFMMLHIGKNVIIALILVSIFYNVNEYVSVFVFHLRSLGIGAVSRI
jgi:hypothetical protein